MAYGLGLGEGGALEFQMFILALLFIGITTVQI
jgi:hypothetical protein